MWLAVNLPDLLLWATLFVAVAGAGVVIYGLRSRRMAEPTPAPATPPPPPPIDQYSGRDIRLTTAEVTSQHDRVLWAEALIMQLPGDHEGRNSWLLNYGRGLEAFAFRQRHNVAFDDLTQSARLS